MQTDPNQSTAGGEQAKPRLSAAELAHLPAIDRLHIGLGNGTQEEIDRFKAGASRRVLDARTAYTKDEIDRLPPEARLEMGLSQLGAGKDPGSALR